MSKNPSQTNYEGDQFQYLKTEKKRLRAMARKIKNIPAEFCGEDGKLSLDKIHLILLDYQKIKDVN